MLGLGEVLEHFRKLGLFRVHTVLASSGTGKNLDFFHSMEVLFPELISIPRKTFPYFGMRQNYGNWTCQHFPQYFQNISILCPVFPAKVVPFFSSSSYYHYG